MKKIDLSAMQSALGARPAPPALEPAAKAAPAYYVPPSRQGVEALRVHVRPSVKLAVRQLALVQGRSVEALLSEAVTDLLRKYGAPASD